MTLLLTRLYVPSYLCTSGSAEINHCPNYHHGEAGYLSRKIDCVADLTSVQLPFQNQIKLWIRAEAAMLPLSVSTLRSYSGIPAYVRNTQWRIALNTSAAN